MAHTMINSTPRAAWNSIAATLEGIERTAAIYAAFLGNSSQKAMPGADDLLLSGCLSAWEAIARFREAFGHSVPAAAREVIERFATEHDSRLAAVRNNSDFVPKRVFVMQLMILAAEVSHAMSDQSEQIRSAAELALRHLQQLIVVDDDVGRKWRKAFADSGETGCERLGGVHLLWHGIQAFKAHADGGRTDLVFAEPITTADESGVQGLVLTEWKKGTAADAAKQWGAARRQAGLYAAGALGGVELRRYRFAVLVSEKAVTPPVDVVEGEVTYRHVNIAVDPDTPAKAAAKAGRAAAA